MSSVDPRWPPPGPAPHRPHPAGYVLAIVLPFLLLLVVAAPAGGVLLWRTLRPAVTAPAVPDPNATRGKPGLGDPYYPDAGNSGYDALRYVIAVNWDVPTLTLSGTTTISARALHRLESFFVDLALDVQEVTVDGRAATVTRRNTTDVEIVPAEPVAPGAPFEVTVRYAGRPGDIGEGEQRPWWSADGEWTAAGEPESAAWWYPSNDHPSDPALMDVSIRVPAGMEALSVGRLESADTAEEADFDTWHWISRQPMATFLNFVSIGQYEVRQGTDAGLPYVYAVSEKLPPADQARAMAALLTSGEKVRGLEAMFGPYPFTELGGVVPVHRFWFGGLETQTRPVYQAESILSADFAPELVTHELAHMWFGDNVTLRQWDDIFDSEAWASWAQWGYAERIGGRAANDRLNRAYDKLAGDERFWSVTMIDPTRQHLFDAVYTRGPMALQALRNVIGDEAFLRLARSWGQTPGTRSLEDWMAAAQHLTPVDLGPFFQAWIYAPTAPARTAANGFR